MAVLNTDLMILERGGVLYNETIANLLALSPQTTVNDTLVSTSSTEALSAGQGKVLKDLIDGLGDVTLAADITARDAAGPYTANDVVFVSDDGDGKWARYQAITAGATGAAATFVKIQDEDALNAGLSATNLGYTASPTDGTVTNTTGADATLPVVDGTNAGLMIPADKTKLDFVSVTQAVDLDAMETASHDAVTTAGTATTNPIAVTGQELSFSISALATAP